MVECIFLDSPPLDVYGQMALDEVLVPKSPQADICLARFFNWRGMPCATFGYAQFENSVKQQMQAAAVKEYTRRPTGGGVVIHKDDLTFSLFFNMENSIKTAEIYANLHKIIREEFSQNNTPLGTYRDKSDYRPVAGGVSQNCFTNPVSDDLVTDEGSKVLGGAIRRFGSVVLYQGSLQLSGARDNAGYKEIIKNAVLKYFNAFYKEEKVSNALLNEAYSLAQSQYKTKQWIEKF